MDTSMYLRRPKDFIEMYNLIKAGKKIRKDRLYYILNHPVAYGKFCQKMHERETLIQQQKDIKLVHFVNTVLGDKTATLKTIGA